MNAWFSEWYRTAISASAASSFMPTPWNTTASPMPVNSTPMFSTEE